jgi:hypothetical protein
MMDRAKREYEVAKIPFEVEMVSDKNQAYKSWTYSSRVFLVKITEELEMVWCLLFGKGMTTRV